MIVKKAIIPKNELPPVDFDTSAYVVRYRIISEDKNRTSQWSPTFVTNVVPVESVSGALSITETIITAVWGDELNRPAYDVFVKFDSGSFAYHGTSPTHSYPFLNTGTTSVRVKVQIASSVKEVNAGLLIFDSGVESLV